MIGMYYVGVLYAYGSHVRNHEFRFESYDVMLLDDVSASRGNYRQLVDLNAYAVADESRMLTVPHIIWFEVGRHDNLFGFSQRLFAVLPGRIISESARWMSMEH